MSEKLHHYRKSYEKDELLKTHVDDNPMQQFRRWFYEVRESGTVDEANAMTVSTIGVDGFPRGRVVLLKKYDENGFYFYTNYESEKGASLTHNKHICLSFFWPVLERQIIIKGKAEKTSREDSVNYFHSRPRGSQLGALVSQQSSVIESREEMERRLQQLERQYADMEIPCPLNWGGYLVRPVEIEFWQGRPNRLHDRLQYKLDGLDWTINRLQP
ncbi:MAG: pyridoxamine 5'-phosphate oxidase [Flavobacteriaceae bacterium]|nr:pyridoxamine 5'-phosphate oxidase [Flavobacteriaceae bacterium]